MPPAVAALEPLSDDEVAATLVYKLLMQTPTPKGIKVTVSKALWPNIDNLPDVVCGEVEQWTNKNLMKLRVKWTESDGTIVHDIEDLHILLRPEMKFVLVKGPRGEALHLRGAALVEHEEATAKETVDVKYLCGGLEKVQVWTVESPEAITNDARKEPRDKPKLNRRPQDLRRAPPRPAAPRHAAPRRAPPRPAAPRPAAPRPAPPRRAAPRRAPPRPATPRLALAGQRTCARRTRRGTMRAYRTRCSTRWSSS